MHEDARHLEGLLFRMIKTSRTFPTELTSRLLQEVGTLGSSFQIVTEGWPWFSSSECASPLYCVILYDRS